ncbi:unnamed protein product [Psylliodes chrysocephalus]|uniref:Uncharacterized protein n=1 Tax=Psylliodes chrysocephalus TaxID=3402493 RepID=A0A9P0GK55_9CUCU|nr:unnamed protein product [Psylliodes chrysocephala]
MRTKAGLINLFSPEKERIDRTKCAYVFDGGMLLHRVPWTSSKPFKDTFARYVKYLEDHYTKEVIVVFDGYDLNCNSIKGAERLRRASNKSCPDIQFDPTMDLMVPKNKFLSSNYNKSRLIKYLIEALQKNGISTLQALDDADSLIVQTALQKDSVGDLPVVVVVAEDIDILVILTALTPEHRTIYFLKAVKGNKTDQVYSSRSLDAHPFMRDNILFLHAMNGAFFRKWKKSVLSSLSKMVENSKWPLNLLKIKTFLERLYSRTEKLFCCRFTNCQRK